MLEAGFFQTVGPHLGDEGDYGLWLGAGRNESGLIITLFYLSHRIIQMTISQMKSKFYFFSSSDICYGIS